MLLSLLIQALCYVGCYSGHRRTRGNPNYDQFRETRNTRRYKSDIRYRTVVDAVLNASRRRYDFGRVVETALWTLAIVCATGWLVWRILF